MLKFFTLFSQTIFIKKKKENLQQNNTIHAQNMRLGHELSSLPRDMTQDRMPLPAKPCHGFKARRGGLGAGHLLLNCQELEVTQRQSSELVLEGTTL